MKLKITNPFRVIIYISAIILMANLNALIDAVLHPDIPYFDEEHLIVGGITCLLTATLFVIIEIHLRRLSKDITRRRQAEEALRKSEKKMEEELLKVRKLESIAILSGGIAHDFNNLLTSIMGYISLSKMSLDPEDEIFKNLSIAEDACLRAKSLTYKLLAFAKGGEPAKRTTSIAKLLKDSATASLTGPKYMCEFSMPEDLCSVEIDESQMIQVIHNLVKNACEAMPEGGIISICAENINVSPQDNLPLNPGPHVKISVKDTGVGIPEENLAKIFDPYFTTKKMDFHKGVGFGLSLCFPIIKKHEGHISVESEQGKGTTFHIYLPASRKEI